MFLGTIWISRVLNVQTDKKKWQLHDLRTVRKVLTNHSYLMASGQLPLRSPPWHVQLDLSHPRWTNPLKYNEFHSKTEALSIQQPRKYRNDIYKNKKYLKTCGFILKDLQVLISYSMLFHILSYAVSSSSKIKLSLSALISPQQILALNENCPKTSLLENFLTNNYTTMR